MANTEIPVQALINKYREENANIVQRALIAETAQEVLEAQLTESRQQTATAQAETMVARGEAVTNEGIANALRRQLDSLRTTSEPQNAIGVGEPNPEQMQVFPDFADVDHESMHD